MPNAVLTNICLDKPDSSRDSQFTNKGSISEGTARNFEKSGGRGEGWSQDSRTSPLNAFAGSRIVNTGGHHTRTVSEELRTAILISIASSLSEHRAGQSMQSTLNHDALRQEYGIARCLDRRRSFGPAVRVIEYKQTDKN